MFNRLSDLKYRRTPEEALGFYLVSALVLLVTLIALGPLMKYAGVLGHTPRQARVVGGVTSMVMGMMYCVALAFMIAIRKRMDAMYTSAFAVLTALAAIPHGVVGLAVVAYMTTRPLDWPGGVKRVQAAAAKTVQAKPQSRPNTGPRPPRPTTPPRPVPVPAAPEQPNETVVSQARRRPERVRPDLSDDQPVDDLMQ